MKDIRYKKIKSNEFRTIRKIENTTTLNLSNVQEPREDDDLDDTDT